MARASVGKQLPIVSLFTRERIEICPAFARMQLRYVSLFMGERIEISARIQN